MHLEVLGSQVALSRQEHLNVLGGGVENRGELRGGHDGRLILQRTAKLKVSIVWRLPVVMGEKRFDARRRENFRTLASGWATNFACGVVSVRARVPTIIRHA